MIREGREVADGSVRTTDVCVVGAGAAGITIARELRGSGLDVIVLEGGGLELEAASELLHDGAMVGYPFGTVESPASLQEVRLRYFGGTTNHWAGYCRPQSELAAAGVAHRPKSGWPIPYDELLRWYEYIAPLLGIDIPKFDTATWSAELGLPEPILTTGDYVTEVTQYRPVRFGSVFRADLEQARDIEVLLHSTVVEVMVDDNSDVVRGVRVAVVDGPRFTVEARIVVVSLGGIENPRLLLASNAVRTQGLGNNHDLVGRHFCEHPSSEIGYVLLDRTTKQLAHYAQTPLPTNEFYGVTSTIVAQAAAVEEHELLDFEAFLVPAAMPQRARGDGVDTPEIGPFARAGGSGSAQSVALVLAIGEQELNPQSRVRLSKERDSLGVPKLELDWRFLDIDRRSMVMHARGLATAIAREGHGRMRVLPNAMTALPDETPRANMLDAFDVDLAALDDTDFPLGYSCHHMCTTRMATDPKHGVVDANLRVHGTANLYVAGASVFPVASSTPPTSTVVSLAARLAEHLVQQWSRG